MELLAAMHPKFLRLPGGNYLEGDHIAERFDWKKTIGPLVDRPTHPSPWRYRSSDGMGLLEFLEWCEDLKMEPVLAVYAGYSLPGEHVDPGPELEPYVQDALDEIEYVTGDTDTKWGARTREEWPSRAVPARLCRDRQRGLVRPLRQLRRPLHAVLQGHQGEVSQPATDRHRAQRKSTCQEATMQPDVLDEHYYRRAEKLASPDRDTTTTRSIATGRRSSSASGRRAKASPTPNLEPRSATPRG